MPAIRRFAKIPLYRARKIWYKRLLFNSFEWFFQRKVAGVAQLVEQRFCKPRVGGSIPLASLYSFFDWIT
jgi:hypothetical protein